jgi:hypothetical protein
VAGAEFPYGCNTEFLEATVRFWKRRRRERLLQRKFRHLFLVAPRDVRLQIESMVVRRTFPR